jgi:hypothetical protein
MDVAELRHHIETVATIAAEWEGSAERGISPKHARGPKKGAGKTLRSESPTKDTTA